MEEMVQKRRREEEESIALAAWLPYLQQKD